MTRCKAFFILLILWSVIYLPGLGSTEFKGEEGRRVLPAITMLDEGNWLVAHVGGKPFLRKPPLINWLIAGSFQLSGVRNEWTARLPSALLVLLLGGAIVALSSGRGWINPDTGLLAAIFWLTSFGLLAKARFAGAEIEGVYVPLSGLAIVFWLAFWHQRRSPWLIWTVPFIFLGLASLAKGPTFHLLFFYLVVLASLGSEHRWRALFHPAHFAGLLIASAIFAAWLIPFNQLPEAKEAAEIWKHQGIDRFTESEFNLSSYALNLPRALMDLFPWVLLCPILFAAARRQPRPGLPFSRAVLFAIVGGFIILLLVPGVLPRYLLPLGVPFALLLAISLEPLPAEHRALRGWYRFNFALALLLLLGSLLTPIAAAASLSAPELGPALRDFDFRLALQTAALITPALALCGLILARRPIQLHPLSLALATSSLIGVTFWLYTLGAVRWINRADDLRPLAAKINAAVPLDQSLVLFDPGYLPAICYLRSGYRYALNLDSLDPQADFILIREQARKKFTQKRPEFQILESYTRGKPLAEAPAYHLLRRQNAGQTPPLLPEKSRPNSRPEGGGL